MMSRVVIALRRISCFYLLISKHFTDPQAIVYVRFSDSLSSRRQGATIRELVTDGRGVMPDFSNVFGVLVPDRLKESLGSKDQKSLPSALGSD